MHHCLWKGSENMHIISKESESEVAQLCPTFRDPMECSLPSSSIHGIFQARVLEWVAIAFSNAWKWKVKVKTLSHIWLLATPWTAPGSSVHGIFQARVLEWVAIAFSDMSPGESSNQKGRFSKELALSFVNTYHFGYYISREWNVYKYIFQLTATLPSLSTIFLEFKKKHANSPNRPNNNQYEQAFLGWIGMSCRYSLLYVINMKLKA